MATTVELKAEDMLLIINPISFTPSGEFNNPDAPISAIESDTTVPKTPAKIKVLCTKRIKVKRVLSEAFVLDANAA